PRAVSTLSLHDALPIFESDSLRLADLEVRQRMAGRWVMSSIQMSFAIMPAAVYWFGGLALAHGSSAISVPTLVAFTTLQTRLFLDRKSTRLNSSHVAIS